MLLSFSEAKTIITQVEDYPTIYDLYWFGSDGTALRAEIVDNAPVQADHLKLFSTLIAPDFSSKFNDMYDRYESITGLPLGVHTACNIDIAWLLAESVLDTQTIETSKIIGVLPDIASRYYGYTGWCLLNEYGDRAIANYDIWGVGYPDTSAKWIKYGDYEAASGEITWYTDKLGFTPPGY